MQREYDEMEETFEVLLTQTTSHPLLREKGGGGDRAGGGGSRGEGEGDRDGESNTKVKPAIGEGGER